MFIELHRQKFTSLLKFPWFSDNAVKMVMVTLRLAWNTLCQQGWPWTHRDAPASTSWYLCWAVQHHAWHDVCFLNLSKIKELENSEITEPVSIRAGIWIQVSDSVSNCLLLFFYITFFKWLLVCKLWKSNRSFNFGICVRVWLIHWNKVFIDLFIILFVLVSCMYTHRKCVWYGCRTKRRVLDPMELG